MRPLIELAEVSPGRRDQDSETINFVPMAAVDAATGMITCEPRSRGELKSGYRRFENGDVIFARITPCMQNGKSAIYRSPELLTGYGSTEFHVLRPRDPRDAPWIWTVLRSDWFISRAMSAFRGTAGQQRVPASFLKEVSIPVPAGDASAYVAAVAKLTSVLNRIDEVGADRNQLREAILPAARNEIFNQLR